MNRSTAISVFMLAAACLALYSGSLRNGFCYDENIVILMNDHVQEDGRLLTILTGTYWGSQAGEQKIDSWGWRPLVILSYYANRKAGGNDPFGYHLVNVLLHVTAGLLVFLLLLRLGFPQVLNLAAAGLFMVHALGTEAVAQVVGRAELLSALAVLGGLHLHLSAVKREDWKARLGWSGLAALVLFLGLMAKEDAAGFVIAAFCVDLFLAGGKGRAGRVFLNLVRSRWPHYALYLAPVAAFLFIRYALLGRALPTFDVHFVDNPMVLLPFYLRPLASLALFGKALLLFVFPLNLSADYGYNQIPVQQFFAMPELYVGFTALVLLTWLALRLRKSCPALLLGWSLFVLLFLPLSSALFTIHTIFGERTLYMPLMGLCILSAGLLTLAVRTRSLPLTYVAAALMILVIAFNLVRTPLRVSDWKNDRTLFESTARAAKDSVRVLNNYGNVLLLRNDLEGAEKQYRRALEIYPDYDDAAVNLAGLLVRKGQGPEAVKILEKVLERRPDHPAAKETLSMAMELGP
jgi:tetratricopeptide (TPR) repeat protein